MSQQNVKEFDNNATNKTKGKMFGNSMHASIILYEKRIKYSLGRKARK
jgi:hypothetical protein